MGGLKGGTRRKGCRLRAGERKGSGQAGGKDVPERSHRESTEKLGAVPWAGAAF